MARVNSSARPLDAQKLTSRRLRLGLTQKQVADRAGTSTSMVCDIEKGRRVGSPDLHRRIADALGVRRVSDLYTPQDAA